ncbi:MAG: ABC transporter permease [Gammaproteobacteria bacterium]|nr:ABC transporter permease [Gammaproteobacteria bacterium]
MSSRSWIAYRTITEREVRRFLRIWGQSLVPSAITTSLYFIVFGGLIGNRIGFLHGFSYAQYITPGLVMLAVITNSYTNVSTSFYLSKFIRNIEEMLVSSATSSVILLGYITGGVLRGLMIGAVVILISLFFTHIIIAHFFVMLLVLVLSSALFSIFGFINALYADNFDQISIIPTFVLTPLTYLGGIFYSIEMLPTHWQIISHFNPVLYMVNTFRYGMLGQSDVNVVGSLIVLFVITVLSYSLAWILLEKGIGIRT